jgi:amino acid adenylation domain-containing protein
MASFVELAARAPDAPALAWSAGRLSYGELHELARGVAARLELHGSACGERVAVTADRSPQTIALVLACLLTGRPVLVVPVDLHPDAQRELLVHAKVNRLLAAAPPDGAVVERAVGQAERGDTSGEVSSEGVALMLTTSGSSGAPKVVALSHGAIARFAAWAGARFEIAPGTTVLNYCGLSFDLSILEVWTTLLHGGCTVLVARERTTQGEHLLDLVLAHQVNVLQGVPMLYALLIEAAASRGRRRARSVEHVILTGDFVPTGTLQRLPDLFERARLYNVYGCTETNDSFLHEIDVERHPHLGAMPLGQPLPGVSALIVDEWGPIDGAGGGELWVSTPFQAAGYLGCASRGSFVADPLGRSRRIYFRSGDLVWRDAAGTIVLRGRNDRQVKIRGARVNLHAVEQAILDAPDVDEAAVVAVADPLAGKRLHAFVRGRRGGGVDTLRLRRLCARKLTRVAIPSIIEVRDEALPKTTTGKVDREALRRSCESGTMETTTTVKRFIVEQFAPDIDAEDLDSRYDLLEGGIIDSLGLLTVLAWAEEHFEVTIDAGEILEEDFRCVQAICALIERAKPTGRSSPIARPTVIESPTPIGR